MVTKDSKSILKLFALVKALLLIGDTFLDVRQTTKYYEFSPYWNPDHEAHLNLSDRMSMFCTTFMKLEFDQSVDILTESELTESQRNLYMSWRDECQTNDFKFGNSYELFDEKIESTKVSLKCFVWTDFHNEKFNQLQLFRAKNFNLHSKN